MSLPNGSIGCLTTNVINAWYNPDSPPLNSNKYMNILFRDAVVRANTNAQGILFFQPDGSTGKYYNAPCPQGWTRNQDLSLNSCNPPTGYTPPAGCSNTIGVGISDKAAIETQCSVSYPSYPKGTAWTTRTMPDMLLNSIVAPDSATGTCPVANPIYVYILPTASGVLNACLEDRTVFGNCFKDSAVSFLETRQQLISQEQQTYQTRLYNNRVQLLAIQNNQTPSQVIQDIRGEAETTENQRLLASQIQTQRQLREQEEALHQNLAVLYGSRFDQANLADLIQKQRLQNQKSLLDSSQNIYLQNQRWRMAKRVQELQGEWLDRILMICKVMFVIFVLAAVAFYYYKRRYMSGFM